MQKTIFIAALLLILLKLTAQAQNMPQGISALFKKDYPAAQKAFEGTLAKEPQNAIALFGMARVFYEKEQALRKRQPQAKFVNFAPYFDLLRQSYAFANKAAEAYRKLSSEQQTEMRKIHGVVEDVITGGYALRVEKEAYDLLFSAPYRKPYQYLYEAALYDRGTDADTLVVLREAIIEQCADFIKDYPRSASATNVKMFAREMLAEYMNLEQIRAYGDRSGRIYEKFCMLVLENYTEDEFRHIIPQFYGAEFGFNTSNYQNHPNFKILQELAAAYQTNPTGLMCRLNLHNAGYHPDKDALYADFISRFAPQDIALVAVKQIARFYIEKREWEQAALAYERFAKHFIGQEKYFKNITSLLRSPEGKREIKNLGPGVNTAVREYSPVITLDGQTLFFSRKTANTGEDIYTSVLESGTWRKAEALNNKVNTRSNEVPLNVSPDGNTLFLFGNYAILPEFFYVLKTERRLGKGDLYYVKREGTGWSRMYVFPAPINTPHFEAGLCMTADGNAILFSSDRPGATGGYMPNYHPDHLYYHGSGEFNVDIYVSERKGDGWSEPVNLGPVINTPYAEMNPWLHPDMKTLYFTSDGHYGLGGYDIFMSKRLKEDSWTEWSEPVNIGKVINSAYNDSFYMTADGSTALISSNQPGNSFGNSDIYSISIPEPFRPDPVMVVVGSVKDAEGKPVSTEVRWQEADNPLVAGKVNTDPETGTFTIPLRKGKRYIYYAEHNELFGASATIDLTGSNAATASYQPAFVMGSVTTGKNKKAFTLPTLHFDLDKDVIRRESFFDLDRLAEVLKVNPDVKLSIEGHTDNIGKPEANLDLSRRRAESVRRYLMQKGCTNQIAAEGFGPNRPVASNQTDEGRQANRRVEFKVLE